MIPSYHRVPGEERVPGEKQKFQGRSKSSRGEQVFLGRGIAGSHPEYNVVILLTEFAVRYQFIDQKYTFSSNYHHSISNYIGINVLKFLKNI